MIFIRKICTFFLQYPYLVEASVFWVISWTWGILSELWTLFVQVSTIWGASISWSTMFFFFRTFCQGECSVKIQNFREEIKSLCEIKEDSAFKLHACMHIYIYTYLQKYDSELKFPHPCWWSVQNGIHFFQCVGWPFHCSQWNVLPSHQN